MSMNELSPGKRSMLFLALFVVFIGGRAHVASAYGYAESTYYAQTTYYTQSTYQTVFTQNAAASGNFAVTGAISKGSGTFVIDHPLDPKNKLLYHSFVESPDVKNFYDGIATLDKKGEAVIRLPAYFDALNKDIRYQLKPIGAPMPDLYVKEEEHDNRFAIGGGVPGGKVSWQITGIRHDPYILANPIVPEVEKGPGEAVDKGEYLFDGYNSGFVTFFTSLWQKVTGRSTQ